MHCTDIYFGIRDFCLQHTVFSIWGLRINLALKKLHTIFTFQVWNDATYQSWAIFLLAQPLARHQPNNVRKLMTSLAFKCNLHVNCNYLHLFSVRRCQCGHEHTALYVYVGVHSDAIFASNEMYFWIYLAIFIVQIRLAMRWADEKSC